MPTPKPTALSDQIAKRSPIGHIPKYMIPPYDKGDVADYIQLEYPGSLIELKNQIPDHLRPFMNQYSDQELNGMINDSRMMNDMPVGNDRWKP